MFDGYKVNIPEGRSGAWGIVHFEAVENVIQSMRMANHGRTYVPGFYTRLYHGHETNVIMSDTPDEIRDHLEIIGRATGRVLINGLGLGVVLKADLSKVDVIHVDVVELEEDVLTLVAPHYDDARVTYHHADAFTVQWPKDVRWDVAWHDIWPTICSDNLPEMTALKRKYGRRVGWQGCWAQDLARRQKRWGY